MTRIDSDKRRIDLQLVRALDIPDVGDPPDLPPVGTLAWGEVHVIKKNPAGGGYLLLRLPGHDRPGLLHRTAMSGELGNEFDADQIERGDEIFIEVMSADANSVRLADRPPTDDGPAATQAARMTSRHAQVAQAKPRGAVAR